MEHSGRIWLRGDESAAARATVTITPDDRVVVRVGDSLVADWALADVSLSDVTDPAEIDDGNVLFLFDPDDEKAWNDGVAAARLRIGLLDAAAGEGTAAAANVDVAVPGSFCRACGAPIDPRAEICVHCGVRQRPIVVRSPKSRITAGLLALFLGGFGIHRFYLGQPVLGILYLLFFWTFIPAMVAFVEALVFFFSSDAAFDAKYNRY